MYLQAFVIFLSAALHLLFSQITCERYSFPRKKKELRNLRVLVNSDIRNGKIILFLYYHCCQSSTALNLWMDACHKMQTIFSYHKCFGLLLVEELELEQPDHLLYIEPKYNPWQFYKYLKLFKKSIRYILPSSTLCSQLTNAFFVSWEKLC